jgi:hypothetical protein
MLAYHLHRLFAYPQIQQQWEAVRDDINVLLLQFAAEENVQSAVSYFTYANHVQAKWNRKVVDVLKHSVKKLRSARLRVKFIKAVPGIPRWLMQVAESDGWDEIEIYNPALAREPLFTQLVHDQSSHLLSNHGIQPIETSQQSALKEWQRLYDTLKMTHEPYFDHNSVYRPRLPRVPQLNAYRKNSIQPRQPRSPHLGI